MRVFSHVRIHVHVFGNVCDFLSFVGNTEVRQERTRKCLEH